MAPLDPPVETRHGRRRERAQRVEAATKALGEELPTLSGATYKHERNRRRRVMPAEACCCAGGDTPNDELPGPSLPPELLSLAVPAASLEAVRERLLARAEVAAAVEVATETSPSPVAGRLPVLGFSEHVAPAPAKPSPAPAHEARPAFKFSSSPTGFVPASPLEVEAQRARMALQDHSSELNQVFAGLGAGLLLQRVGLPQPLQPPARFLRTPSAAGTMTPLAAGTPVGGSRDSPKVHSPLGQEDDALSQFLEQANRTPAASPSTTKPLCHEEECTRRVAAAAAAGDFQVAACTHVAMPVGAFPLAGRIRQGGRIPHAMSRAPASMRTVRPSCDDWQGDALTIAKENRRSWFPWGRR
eukprot:TRINITY_DN44882_c0_g1_i1.p1 TRINITY_DN44882_c0_g1~~TRINITY_DN44882_c0_g1_i1.p1  ORF type:complete len:358 (-),score=63.86 TRINITY_DN44882_c0_g1_i1:115-1188(-)